MASQIQRPLAGQEEEQARFPRERERVRVRVRVLELGRERERQGPLPPALKVVLALPPASLEA